MSNSAASAEQFDAVVVGAGIMGSCAAFEISKRGASVVLVERFDLLHHLGSSHGESRTTRTTYPEPYYAAMAALSRRLWLEAEALSGYRVLTPTPHLDVGPADCPALQLAISNCRAQSIPLRLLDADQLAAEFSGAFRIPDGWLAAVSDLGGVIKPTKAVAMFQSLARAKGAVLRDRTRVVAVRRSDSGDLLVSCEKGVAFRARKVVLAAGAWTAKLLRDVAEVDLPIQPLHTTICYWKIRDGVRSSELTPDGGFPTFASYGEPYIYGTPSLEYPGLLKVALHRGVECDPDRRCWIADAEEARRTVGPFVEEVLGGMVEAEGPAMMQTCMYSMTPDGDYVIDYVGGELGRDVVVAAGFSGHGFKMGPLVGKVAADMALSEEEVTDVELRYFRASRFSEDSRGNRKEFENPIPVGSQSG